MKSIKSFDEFILEFRSDGSRDPRADLKQIIKKHGGVKSNTELTKFLLPNITDANIIDVAKRGGFLGIGEKKYDEIRDKYEKKYAKPGQKIFFILLDDGSLLVIKFPEKEYDKWIEVQARR
jgi:hypothetical protein